VTISAFIQRTLFLLMAASLAAVATAQNSGLQPVLQTGHEDDILFADADASAQVLATADKHNVILWNSSNGRQLRKITSGQTIRGMALCNKASQLAILLYDYGIVSALYWYNTQTGALTDSISFKQTNAWGSSFPPMDALISSGQNDEVAVRSFSTLQLINLTTKQRSPAIELFSYDNQIAYNASTQRWQIAANRNDQVELHYINDSYTKQLQTIYDRSEKPMALSFHASGKMAMLLAPNKLMIFNDADTTLQEETLRGSNNIRSYEHYDVRWNIAGNLLLSNIGQDAHVYDAHQQTWINDKNDALKYANHVLAIDDSNDKIAAIGKQLPSILRWPQQQNFTSFDTKVMSLQQLRFSPNGKMLSSVPGITFADYSHVIDLSTGRLMHNRNYPLGIYQWLSDSLVLTTVPNDFGDKPKLAQVCNFYTGNVLQTFVPPKAEKKPEAALLSPDRKAFASINALYKELVILKGPQFSQQTRMLLPTTTSTHIEFTPDSRYLIVGSESIRIYDIQSNKWKVLRDTARVYSIDNFTVTPDSKELWFELLDNKVETVIYSYSFSTGEYRLKRKSDTLISIIKHHPTKPMYAIGYFNGVVEIRDAQTDVILFLQKVHDAVVDEVLFHPTRNWVSTLGSDQLLRCIDIDKQSTQYSMALLSNAAEKGPAIFTPDRYYMMPPTLTTEMHFAKGFQTYSFAQFDLQLNRPDIVLQRMGEAAPELIQMQQKAAERRWQKAGMTAAQDLQAFDSMEPLLLYNRKELSNSSTEPVVEMQFITRYAAANIKQLTVYVNGQKAYTGKAGTNRWKIPVALSAGNNLIEASYLNNNGTESLRESIDITFEPVTPVEARTYYIGIAVSHYADSNYNLQYATKDVQDIAQRFQQQYSNASVHLYTDTAVTLPLLDRIHQLLQQTTVHDRVVVSYSGHGLLDTGYNFYLASYATSFEQPALHSIPYASLTNIFTDVPARQKLLLIDACHSGEIDKENVQFNFGSSMAAKPLGRSSIRKVQGKTQLGNTVKLMETYFTDVSKDLGVNIISAAAGEEYALESSEWNNGVFSYSFMQALFDKKADSNYDKKITQTELRKYMQQRVQELTNGKQQPTSRSVNASYDWAF